MSEETYHLYKAEYANGDYELKAILDNMDGDSPSDYFRPGAERIDKIGTIGVTGDHHQLGEYFSVK